MTDRRHEETRAYCVSVTFRSGCDAYAVQTCQIEARDAFDAERLARDEAQDSVYFDARIPDLNLEVIVSPSEPDDDPSAPPSAAVPTCPRCGSDDIVKDACAHWDQAAGCWSLSGTYDCETCLTCSAEGDDMAVWVPPDSIGPADRYLWAVAQALQRDDVVLEAAFQEFCLNSFDRISAEQAADEWRSRIALGA